MSETTNLIATERARDRALQLQAITALAEMVAEADRLGLPPLTWTVSAGQARTLTGHVPDTDPDPQETVRAWAAFCDLAMPKPHRAFGHCPHDEDVVISVAYDPEFQDPTTH